ncbi:MAG TPA: DUF4375 domain-containing protein [Abditibacteriaceae bacterium]|jgi:hypothetical protein
MENNSNEKVMVKQSANQAEGRRYVYSQEPNTPKVRVVLGKEHESWELRNALVDLAFLVPYDELSEMQCVLHLIMRYDSEVHNGGHGQYFANNGTEHLEELLQALRKVGANQQHEILKAASQTTMPKRAKGIRGVLGFVSYAQQNEQYDYDKQYYACKPSADELAIQFAKTNLDQFVKLA